MRVRQRYVGGVDVTSPRSSGLAPSPPSEEGRTQRPPLQAAGPQARPARQAARPPAGVPARRPVGRPGCRPTRPLAHQTSRTRTPFPPRILAKVFTCAPFMDPICWVCGFIILYVYSSVEIGSVQFWIQFGKIGMGSATVLMGSVEPGIRAVLGMIPGNGSIESTDD